MKCPVCLEGGVAENTKAFYCTLYRQGCRFTLWKDCLQKGGGPQLTAKLVPLLIKNGSLQGSTGNLTLREGFLSFTSKGADTPSVRVPITYTKAGRK